VPIDKEIPATWIQFRDAMPTSDFNYGWGEWSCPDGQKPILHEKKSGALTIELAKPTCKAAD
jgi:hypothetical protein